MQNFETRLFRCVTISTFECFSDENYFDRGQMKGHDILKLTQLLAIQHFYFRECCVDRLDIIETYKKLKKKSLLDSVIVHYYHIW